MTILTYTYADLDRIFRRERLISEEELLNMWRINKRTLRALVNGHDRRGVHLPAVRFSAKQIAFRLADVMRVEQELWG